MHRFTLEELRLRKQRKEDMKKLYESGMSLQEIADEMGISRQRVHQIIGKQNKSLFKPFTAKRCVYAGLRKWLNDNKVSTAELTRRLYGNTHGENYERTRLRLCGSKELNKTYIDKLLKITGLTYDEAFGSEDNAND